MMKWFRNLKIANKLVLGFLVVTLLTVTVGVVGISNMLQLDKADTELYEENTMGISHSGMASASFQRLRYNYLMLTLADNAVEEATRINNIESLEQSVLLSLNAYKEIVKSDEGAVLIQEIINEYNTFNEVAHKALELYRSGNKEESARIIQVDTEEISVDLYNQLDNLVGLDLALANEKAEDNTQLTETALVTNVTIIAASILLSIFLGFYISTIISRPLRTMGEVANRLAIGDSNVSIEINSKDETGMLAKAFQAMLENIKYQVEIVEKFAEGDLTIDVSPKSEVDTLGIKLKEMVEANRSLLHSISIASEHIASSARQVSESSIILSQGAAEQASSVEELTASLEEISSQTHMNADKANAANNNAMIAQNNADMGTLKMQEMLQAMDQISESSSSISNVIKVIDDIAFQTNILALNAAVEAARAGHLGKGFAVVAEEVRNLAARSASAAKETTDMIASSIKKSEDGTRIAKETADSLNQIVTSIKQANGLVEEIAQASNDQATSIEQINIGIEQVLGVVQANSATSEENAAASEELAGQSEILKETVLKYKI